MAKQEGGAESSDIDRANLGSKIDIGATGKVSGSEKKEIGQKLVKETGKPNLDMTDSMSGRRVDFGVAGEGKGLSWGIEVDIDISDKLIRSKLESYLLKIPSHIKKITYLELAPQEALQPKDRTVRSTIKPVSIRGGSSLLSVAAPNKLDGKLKKVRYGLNLLKPQDESRIKALKGMMSWVFGPFDKHKKLSKALEKSSGDTIVIVHGHSDDMSGMGEQYPDELKNDSGDIIQRKYNLVLIDKILERYNDPEKFASIILHGCNPKRGRVDAKNIPVFYPMYGVKSGNNPQWLWSPRPGGIAMPE